MTPASPAAHRSGRRRLAAPVGLLLLAMCAGAGAARAQQPAAADTAAPAKLPPEQLQSLVAPIALYPDDLLAQTLAASTYPLEIVQLQQWLAKHPGLKDKALVDSVATQSWDPSVQSMAAVPEVVKRLADDIQWTTELGNAFLAQQADVMKAVQEMRKKAKDKGALKSSEQQKVETKQVEGQTVIVVESANPEVVYVPTYAPAYVYPPPVYPYPPIYYPPYTPGAAFVTFSVGFFMGAAIWGGSCCHSYWGGGGNVYINHNNNFNNINVDRGNQINTGGRGQGGRGDSWQHNPSHRGGTPYGDRATASKYGGSARGAGVSDRAGAGAAGRPGGAAGGAGGAGVGNRAAGGPGGAGVGDRAASGPGGGSRGGESIGNRSMPSSGSSRAGGFDGGSRGYSGSSARASSSRGASSYGGSRGGGGFSRGGGGGGRRR